MARRPWRRAQRIVTFAALLVLIPIAVSYGQMLTARSNSSLSIRTVEWIRSNGGRGLVNQVELLWYSLNAPAKGGPGLRALPHQIAVGPAIASPHAGTHHRAPYRPAPIRPVIHPALPGEGHWRATFAGHRTRPPVLVTSFRPAKEYPKLVAGVAWIDHTQTTTWLYPGIQEPAVSMPSRGPEQVPTRLRRRLVATFNSAFKLQDSGGGFVSGSHTYASMKDGLATILRHRDGRVDIVRWTGSTTAPADVLYARQNLPLIVDNGRLSPNLSNGPEWGATLGNSVLVWRSGVGIDRHGNLIYAVANDQTVASLARILKRAGAVRAMQLDINAYWPSFITYRHPGAVGAANLLSGMTRSAQRYLTPDDRDFFGVYVK